MKLVVLLAVVLVLLVVVAARRASRSGRGTRERDGGAGTAHQIVAGGGQTLHRGQGAGS